MHGFGYVERMGVWSVRFYALTLALGEPRLTLAESTPDRIRYAWTCGCHAITADGMNCLITTCPGHHLLFPPETAISGSSAERTPA
jgi:hypothetical protein